VKKTLLIITLIYIHIDDTVKIILSVKKNGTVECTGSFPEKCINPKLEGAPLKKAVKHNIFQSASYGNDLDKLFK